MSATPLPLSLYAGLATLLGPLARGLIALRRRRGKEHATRFTERLGRPGLARPRGFLVWLHAASVGETMSVLPLARRLAESGAQVLLTTGTVTSAALAAERLPPGALHQFVPLDLPGAARRFLDHWQPGLALFCESELWPNLMRACLARGIPLGIVNGRMSARSARSWARMPRVARALLAPLAFCLAQSEADAARYAALGAPARGIGNLKFDVPPLPIDVEAHRALTDAIGPRPVLVAASTHPGEEVLVLDAFRRMRDARPETLLILVPRHPARGAEVVALATERGFSTGQRSKGDIPRADQAVHVADTLGELGLFYALATLAFIGGSLVPIGGHNPIEPAKLGAPMLHGPHVHNFADMFATLDREGAARPVADPAALAEAVLALLADDAARARLAERARDLVGQSEGALERTMAALAPYLPGEA